MIPKTALQQQITELADHYPAPRSAVMPALHLAQAHYGYLSPEAMSEVADCLHLPRVVVLEIATFYSMYHLQPVGRFHLQLCTNLSCMLRGAEQLMKQLEQQLAIRSGETTADGRFTLTAVECLGACEQAPVMQLNDDYLGDLDEQKLTGLLQRLQELPGVQGPDMEHPPHV